MARIKKDKIGTHSTILRHVPPWFATRAEMLSDVRYKMRYAGMTQKQIAEMEQAASYRASTSTVHMLDLLWQLFEEWKAKKE